VAGGLQGMAAMMLASLVDVPHEGIALPVMMVVLCALTIYGSVVMLVWLYKMWTAIQDGHARSTPGLAIGFLFVPLFNLYWVFQAFWGFAKDYNQYARRHALSVPKLSAGVHLACSIFCLVSITAVIPHVGYFVIQAQSILAAVMITRSCDAVNALPAEPAVAALTL
jgi:hypothetical protein